MLYNLNKYNIILASQSPRRQFLLKELGINFTVVTKNVNESFPGKLKAQAIPLYLCEKKASAFEIDPKDNTLLITADTIVWFDNHVLNKPATFQESFNMLHSLSGNIHEVYTGVCLKTKDATNTFYVKSEVCFNKVSKSEIEKYITNFKPFDKAGSYGAQECLPVGMNPCSPEEINFLNTINKIELIQSSIQTTTAIPIIKKINGSYFNVMGLPIVELYNKLKLY